MYLTLAITTPKVHPTERRVVQGLLQTSIEVVSMATRFEVRLAGKRVKSEETCSDIAIIVDSYFLNNVFGANATYFTEFQLIE